MMLYRFSRRIRVYAGLVACTIVLAACSSDQAQKAEASRVADSIAMFAANAQWNLKKKAWDSVSRIAPTASQVAKEKGSMYDVADAALTAAVLKEAEKTRDCYTKAARDYDRNLAGVIDVLVNLGGAGWDIVRVEHSTWSSAAGGAAETCIDARAKAEWKLPTKGVKPGAHLVHMTFRPDSGTTPKGDGK